MHIQQITIGQVSTEIAAALQNFNLSSLQRHGFDVGVIHPADGIRRGEQDSFCARQYLGPTVCDFVGSQFAEGLYGAASRGNSLERSEKSHRRHDSSVVAPTGALCTSP